MPGGLGSDAKEEKWWSNTVSAIVVPDDIDARYVIANGYSRYRTSFGAGLSKVAGRVFRIGHLGDLNEVMCLAALASAEMSLRDAGAKVEAGSGVAAAQEWYRTEIAGNLQPQRDRAA